MCVPSVRKLLVALTPSSPCALSPAVCTLPAQQSWVFSLDLLPHRERAREILFHPRDRISGSQASADQYPSCQSSCGPWDQHIPPAMDS